MERMAWHTLDGRQLGAGLKKLAVEMAEAGARERIAPRKPTPTDIWIDDDGRHRVRAAGQVDHARKPYIGPSLRAHIDKVAREMSALELDPGHDI